VLRSAELIRDSASTDESALQTIQQHIQLSLRAAPPRRNAQTGRVERRRRASPECARP